MLRTSVRGQTTAEGGRSQVAACDLGGSTPQGAGPTLVGSRRDLPVTGASSGRDSSGTSPRPSPRGAGPQRIRPAPCASNLVEAAAGEARLGPVRQPFTRFVTLIAAMVATAAYNDVDRPSRMPSR